MVQTHRFELTQNMKLSLYIMHTKMLKHYSAEIYMAVMVRWSERANQQSSYR